MKLRVYEVVDKIRDIDRLTANINEKMTDTVELDPEDANELISILEEYRDMILSREVNF